jgi:hypothetical protein
MRRVGARAQGERAPAPARHAASETPRIALAPSLALHQPNSLVVPSSSSIMNLSSFSWSVGSMPSTLGPMIELTLSTAFITPLPIQSAFTPSRSSSASYAPVLAPLGTAARKRPSSVITSTSTVGLPRLSKIWRALTALIVAMSTCQVPAEQHNPMGRVGERPRGRESRTRDCTRLRVLRQAERLTEGMRDDARTIERLRVAGWTTRWALKPISASVPMTNISATASLTSLIGGMSNF